MERRTCTSTLFPFISTDIHFSILLPTTTVLQWYLNDNNKNKLPFQAGSVSRSVFAVRSPVRIVASVRLVVVVVDAFCELALSTRSVLSQKHFSLFSISHVVVCRLHCILSACKSSSPISSSVFLLAFVFEHRSAAVTVRLDSQGSTNGAEHPPRRIV